MYIVPTFAIVKHEGGPTTTFFSTRLDEVSLPLPLDQLLLNWHTLGQHDLSTSQSQLLAVKLCKKGAGRG